MLTLAPLRAFIAEANDAGIRATENPGQLVPPGFLVQLQSLEVADTLGGGLIRTRWLAVVPASTYDREADELVALVTELMALADPDGPIAAASVVLPNIPAPLPALSFPLNIPT